MSIHNNNTEQHLNTKKLTKQFGKRQRRVEFEQHKPPRHKHSEEDKKTQTYNNKQMKDRGEKPTRLQNNTKH